MHDAVAIILATEDFNKLREELFDRLLGTDQGGVSMDDRAARALSHSLGRMVWNAIPLPSNGWRPKPIAAPSRNDVCPCGSGQKFKNCCGGMPPTPPISPEQAWGLVIEVASPAQLEAAIAGKRMPNELVGMAGIVLNNTDRAADVLRLIAPMLAAPYERINPKLATAVDAVADAYLTLGRQDERMRWLSELAERGPRALRVEANQRLATMYADLGDTEAAWDRFAQARKDAPNLPNTGMLELTLLINEERFDEAKSRAESWLARLARDEDMPAEILDFFESIAADPRRQARRSSANAATIDVARIDAIVAGWSSRALPNEYELCAPPALDSTEGGEALAARLREHLRSIGVDAAQSSDAIDGMVAQMQRLSVVGDGTAQRSAGPAPGLDAPDTARDRIMLAAALAPIEAKWHEVWPLPKPMSIDPFPMDDADPWEDAAAWLALLESEPAAGDSLDILDDVAMALMLALDDDDSDELSALLYRVLERGFRIVEAVAPRDASLRLPWGYPQNRSGLRLAVEYMHDLLDAERESDGSRIAERILQWSPEDEHGVRSIVIDERLRQANWSGAIAIGDAYPADAEPNVRFGHALALFALGRADEARTALREAVKINRHVADALGRVNYPAPSDFAPPAAQGSKQQAYFYRLQARDIWEQVPGALRWLAGAAR